MQHPISIHYPLSVVGTGFKLAYASMREYMEDHWLRLTLTGKNDGPNEALGNFQLQVPLQWDMAVCGGQDLSFAVSQQSHPDSEAQPICLGVVLAKQISSKIHSVAPQTWTLNFLILKSLCGM